MSDSVTLTPDQQKAADAFFAFLMSDAKEFILSGGPGVGKTFLMSHLCKRVMKDYEDACRMMNIPMIYRELSFTATTNKAAEVLEQNLGLPVDTIHSYLGLIVRNDFKTGKQKLTKSANWCQHENVIVFIDESSMIDSLLHRIIQESFVNSKIIYVGDHAQMAPVGERSPIYLSVDPDNFVFLSQPVRNAGQPALVDLCKTLRATVEDSIFRFIEASQGVVEYLDDEAMQARLHEHFAAPGQSDARILCYTNSRVETFNAYIREIQGLPNHFIPGDVVVTASTYPVSKSRILNTERELTIVAVSKEETVIGYENLLPDQLPVKSRKVMVRDSFKDQFEISIPVDKDRWFKAIQILQQLKDWPAYFELKEACADLRFKSACTVYKSQGSTYHTVFIDIGNIGTSYDADQVARMLLVGASRATTKVYLFGRLPVRYRGAKAA